MRCLQIYQKRDSGTCIFLWILWTLRTPFYIEHLQSLLLIIQFSPLNQWNNKYTWFSRKIFLFYWKWKIKNVVLDVQSAAHLEAFLIKQGVLFFACLQYFRHAQRHVHAITCLICRSLIIVLTCCKEITIPTASFVAMLLSCSW